jgi:hypothetical protein
MTLKGTKFTEEHKRKIGLANKGKHMSEEQKKFLSELQKTRQRGKNNNNYGRLKENIKYKPLHAYMRKYIPKPELCECCNQVPPYEVANKGIYDRDFKNWSWLCRKCHMMLDGRLNKLIENRRNRS